MSRQLGGGRDIADPAIRISGATLVPTGVLPTVAMLTLVILSMSGCASYRAMPLDGESSAHARRYRQELHGVTLAADLVSEPSKTRALFFDSLQERGIVPIVLHVQNQGDRTLVLQRERIVVRLESGEVFSPLDPQEVIDECSTSSAWAWLGLPLVFPYVMARNRIEGFNFELHEDYQEKSLEDYLRLAPDDPPMAKALFFRLSPQSAKQLDRSPSIEIPVEVEALDTEERNEPGENVRFLLSLG